MLTILLAALTLVAAPPKSVHPDSCAAEFPADVRAAVAHQFPGYSLPRQADNLAEDIKYNLEQGGNGCLGVATGDFGGDGKRDLAFLLTSKSKVWLVVATAHGKSWILDKVWEAGGPSDRARLYVDVAAAGKYDDLGLSDELEPGQVVTFTSDHQVVVAGLTESSGVAFMKTPKGWVHVWISD